MCTETEKIQSLANYLETLRKIHTTNCTNSPNKLANQHLIAANVKLQDAIMHIEMAFDILVD